MVGSISSYGIIITWATQDYKDTAPLNKSHENFGFEEPIIYFPFAAVEAMNIDVVADYFSNEDDKILFSFQL